MTVACHAIVESLFAADGISTMISYRIHKKNLEETIDEIFEDNKYIMCARITVNEEGFEYGHF